MVQSNLMNYLHTYGTDYIVPSGLKVSRFFSVGLCPTLIYSIPSGLGQISEKCRL